MKNCMMYVVPVEWNNLILFEEKALSWVMRLNVKQNEWDGVGEGGGGGKPFKELTRVERLFLRLLSARLTTSQVRWLLSVCLFFDGRFRLVTSSSDFQEFFHPCNICSWNRKTNFSSSSFSFIYFSRRSSWHLILTHSDRKTRSLGVVIVWFPTLNLVGNFNSFDSVAWLRWWCFASLINIDCVGFWMLTFSPHESQFKTFITAPAVLGVVVYCSPTFLHSTFAIFSWIIFCKSFFKSGTESLSNFASFMSWISAWNSTNNVS